ncbi:thioredoxin-dependent thiol peroxidase [Poriferisphaera sp. WC338]|uniref:thioredoxin-dependent thiol peroxidase n=1 Tax=Poriferisphaera sp. WC338 TaxID=3425129 RepID=UPI003D81862A
MAKKKVAKKSYGIEVGKKAPAFTLADQSGEKVKLSDHKGKWVVLYFYPKDNTSGCTTEACAFRDEIEVFTGLDAVVLGVSPDDVTSHGKFAGKYDLPFSLLADVEKKVCEKYGVWQEKSLYGRKFMGVVRTTYVIDPSGKIAAKWGKVRVKDHVSAVREMIETLQQ